MVTFSYKLKMYSYALGVLMDMLYGYFVAILTLSKYIRPSFSLKERKVYRREIQSIYFNFALMHPIFKECLHIKKQRIFHTSLEKCIVLSAYLLVGDILLDEKVESKENSAFALLINGLKLPVNEFSDEHLNRMISDLQKAQVSSESTDLETTLELKGLWLPTLMYPLALQWKEHELECFQLVGAWLKLADDYADRENDNKNGVITMCSHKTAPQAENIFKKYGEKVKNALTQLSSEPSAVSRFCRNISWQTNVFIAYEKKMSTKSASQQKTIRQSLVLQLFEMIKASFTLQKA